MTRKTIVITGCSSGFGRSTALELARQGWLVFGTVRKESDRGSLLQEAESQQCSQNITVLLCDILQHEQIVQLAQDVETLLRTEQSLDQEHLPRLDALLNNAGTAYAGPIELVPVDDIRSQFEINVIAHIDVTKAFLPFLKVARGTAMYVSSIAGRISMPITGIYAASKYALEALCDALRIELAPFGVQVVLIEPASSPTAIWSTSLDRSLEHLDEANDTGGYGRLLKTSEKFALQSAKKGFPVQQFADTVVHILNSSRPRARYGIPRSATAMMLLRRFLPDSVWDRLIRLMLHW
jgi:NAD(P)-dependent dehydrogenase (short-subunit alcohol dehydrogenase family)